MSHNLVTIDYVIIIGYMVFALLVGLVLTKKASKSTEDYFLGGRNMPWWLVGISMVATSYAADTPLAVTEMIRQHGIQRAWFLWSACIGLILGIFLFARLWRRANIVTDAEYMELRYSGRAAALLRGFKAFQSGVLNNLLVMAFVTMAMSSVITTLADVNRWTAIGVCIAVALTYSVLSGFYGVVVTDFVQFFMAMFGMIYLAVVSLQKVGGIHVVMEKVSALEGHSASDFSIFPDFAHSSAIDIFALFVFMGLMWFSDAGGYVMQRMSACKNERDSVLATLFFAVFNTSRVWPWIVVALVSIVLFPDLSHLQNGDTRAYPMVINAYLGPGWKGLLVTCFLAAYMSTIDTHLNWGASYIITDMYKRFMVKKGTERHYMIATKLAVVVLMSIAAVLVPLVPSVKSGMEFYALVGVGVSHIAFSRWFWWRITAWTELSVLVASACIAIVNLILMATAPEMVIFGFELQHMPFVVKFAMILPVTVSISLVVTFLTEPTKREKLNDFYRLVRPGGFWSVVDPEIRALPGKAVDFKTIWHCLSGLLLCFGVSLGIGYSILQQLIPAVCAWTLALVGAIGVAHFVRLVQREFEAGVSDEADEESS